MRPTDPFDRHPAVPLSLGNQAGTLERLAGEAVDHQVVTDRVFDPAVAAWDGLAAPELQAAPEPVRAEAKEVALQVAWAAVPLRFWAEQVSEFNAKVDDLQRRRDEIPAEVERRLREQFGDGLMDLEQAPELRSARLFIRSQLLHGLEQEWHTAFGTHIEDGERTAAGMFRDGPTRENLESARELGALPAGPMADWAARAWDRAAAVEEAEQLAGKILELSAPQAEGGPERLAAILDEWADDEQFAFQLLTRLGPDGVLELNARVALLGDSDGEDVDERWAQAVAGVQAGLAVALATATARRGTGGTHSGVPYEPGEFELGPDWIRELELAGRELVEVRRSDGSVVQVYGYQLLGVLLGQGGFDDDFLSSVGSDMIDFEMAHGEAPPSDGDIEIMPGDSGFWLEVREEGMRLNWVDGTGVDSPAGFDPMIGLMEALAESPEATRQILTGRVTPDGTAAGLVRLDYLLTDRDWPADLTTGQSQHYLHQNVEPPASPGIAAFGPALEGATMVDPDERSHRIVEAIIYELATDEQAMGLPNGEPDHRFAGVFRNTDIMHPDLRQSMANITDAYIGDIHWALAVDLEDVSSDYRHAPQLDLDQISPRHLQLFLADLGKDTDARDTVVAAEYAHAASLLEQQYLDGWDGTGDAPPGIKGGVLGPTSRAIAALDVGASSQMRADVAAEDEAHNDALRNRFFWIGLGASTADGVPVVGGPADHASRTVLDELERQLQRDSTGRANYYHGDLKHMEAQIMTDMVKHAVHQSVTAEITPDELLSRMNEKDIDEGRLLIYPEDHPRSGEFVPMEEWGMEHHKAWGKFISAEGNNGIQDLMEDTWARYEDSVGSITDSVEAD